jgi:hypothetical protein
MQADKLVTGRTVNTLKTEFQQQLDEDGAFEQYRGHTADYHISTLSEAEHNIKAIEEAQRRRNHDG